MSLEVFPVRSTIPELWENVLVLLGTGASSPTKVHGGGMTVTWISTGLYEVLWTDNPGNFVGQVYGFNATTASAVAGYTLAVSAYPSTAGTYKIRLSVYNSSFALADLAALQWLTVNLLFKQSAV